MFPITLDIVTRIPTTFSVRISDVVISVIFNKLIFLLIGEVFELALLIPTKFNTSFANTLLDSLNSRHLSRVWSTLLLVLLCTDRAAREYVFYRFLPIIVESI